MVETHSWRSHRGARATQTATGRGRGGDPIPSQYLIPNIPNPRLLNPWRLTPKSPNPRKPTLSRSPPTSTLNPVVDGSSPSRTQPHSAIAPANAPPTPLDNCACAARSPSARKPSADYARSTQCDHPHLAPCDRIDATRPGKRDGDHSTPANSRISTPGIPTPRHLD